MCAVAFTKPTACRGEESTVKVVSGGADQTVKIWDATTVYLRGFTGSIVPLRSCEGHSQMVVAVGFSNSGEHVASGSNDNSVRVWDANGCPEPKPLRARGMARIQHTAEVGCVCLSEDGRWAVSGSTNNRADNNLLVWSMDTGTVVYGGQPGHFVRPTAGKGNGYW